MTGLAQLPKKVLVAGGNGQIGLAVIDALEHEDVEIVALVRNKKRAVDLAATHPDVQVVAADLETETGLRLAGEYAAESEALAICVGVTGLRVPVWKIGRSDWDNMAAVNVRPVVCLVSAAIAAWIERRHSGVIVTLSSPGVPRAHRHRAVYDASRAAVESFTRAAAVDAGEYGIRVNGVRPAAVGVPADDNPLRRGVDPYEVAKAIQFLLSDAASAITGHHLDVDAGLLAALRSPGSDRVGDSAGADAGPGARGLSV